VVRELWLNLVDSVLRPARPHLERCVRERERHLAERRHHAEVRAEALASCERRVEIARAEVFAANDGVVTSRMTDLEREWRMLRRSDPDAGLMDLWARVAPVSWIDRKRWRDSHPDARLEAAIALTADVEGVEAAESAIDSLRAACAAWGVQVGSRIQWRPFDRDSEHAAELLAEPLRSAREALSARDVEHVERVVLERAHDLERDVYEAARARFPERALLARDLAHVAFVDCVWRAASLSARPNPVTSLCDLWKTGYVLSAIDASGVTIEIPPL
jgi:hypothetical protein